MKPTLRDELAIERTIMGADRTLLAWVRTSLSLISFGFTIFKVLDYIRAAGIAKIVRPQTPRNLGIFMILVGVVPLALAMAQHRGTVRRLRGRSAAVLSPSMVAAAAILLLGFLLLAAVAMHFEMI